MHKIFWKTGIAIFLLVPSVVFGSFPTDNFDSYTSGNALNTLSGGTGWSNNWSASGAVITNSHSDTSPNSVDTSSDVGNPTRDFSIVTVGTFCYAFYQSSPTDEPILRLYNSGSPVIYQRTMSGNLEYYDGSNYVSLGAVSSATWHDICIDIDQTNHPFQARYSLDNGSTFSSWVNRANNTDTGVTTVILFQSVALIDSIHPFTGGGGGGSGTTTPTFTGDFSTTTQRVDNVNEDYFYGVIIFYISMWTVIYIFKKR